MTMTRKEFLGTVLTGVAAVALVGACGDDGGSADAAVGTPDGAAGTPDGAAGTPDASTMLPDAGGSTSPDATVASCTGNGAKNGTITGNHGHSLVVPLADVNAASMDRTYSIKGSSAHNHNLTITSAQFDQLKQNTAGFVITSTNDGHMHDVTVICA